MKANVYIDGFNVYYSALRRRFPDCRWLDVRRLAELLFADDEIARVKYFTARVSDEPDWFAPRLVVDSCLVAGRDRSWRRVASAVAHFQSRIWPT